TIPSNDVAGIIVEPIQGEAGIIVPPRNYFNKLTELCKQEGWLLIVDEIWTGLGRTGKIWASEHFHLQPDIMTFAKSCGGGLPLGGIIAKSEIANSWEPGRHGSTFGGNPVACAAGIATIKTIIEKDLHVRAAKLGEYTLKRLKELQEKSSIIGEVRGKGLMIGIELVKNKESKEPLPKKHFIKILSLALKRGLILLSGGIYFNVLRIAPPLIISQENLNIGLSIIEEVIKKVENEITS
ncbi:MAG: hypothetical protein DRJ37_07285, partial [Thermoprotei archaeon]